MSHYRLLWFALKYLKGALKTPVISTMIIISCAAIFLSSFSMSLILSIMLGFERATYTTLQSVNPEITIEHKGKELNIAKLVEVITQEFPEVESSSPLSFQQGLLQQPENQASTFVTIEGIDPINEQLTTRLSNCIVSESPTTLTKSVHDNHVLIGYKLANILDVLPGESIELIYAPHLETKGNKLIVEQTHVTISNFIKTGIETIDANFIIMDNQYFEKLFGTRPTILGIKLHQSENSYKQKVIERLRNRLKLDVYSWEDLYPSLLDALRLEKYAMILIVCIVILLALLSSISTLYMKIRQKQSDIALLQAMGMPKNNVVAIFVYMETILCSISSITGLIVSYIVGKWIEHSSWFQLPDVYYVSHVPLYYSWTISISIFIAILTISFLTLLMPLRSIKTLSISEVLRFEG